MGKKLVFENPVLDGTKLSSNFNWIYGNRSKSHIESYKIINLKFYYKQPRIVSTPAKLTHKLDRSTVFESFQN